MAFRQDIKNYEKEYYNFLFPLAYPNATEEVKNWILNYMIPNGDVTVESVLETAIAVQNNIRKYSTVGSDFLGEDGEPGGDAKKASAAVNPHRPRMEARISDFRNKTGDLYACVYEPVQAKFYFFNIPFSYHTQRKSLMVYFELDGSPRRNRMRPDTPEPLWQFECPTGIYNLVDLKKI